MADKPILFSAPMVRALLDGRKTQTRRLLKRPSWAQTKLWPEGIMTEQDIDGRLFWFDKNTGCLSLLPVHQPRNRLWVRETWTTHSTFAHLPPRQIPVSKVFYAADNAYAPSNTPWRPSIFMPRWASRMTLVVTAVRVQRLQDIGEKDAVAEGIQRIHGGYHDDDDVYENYVDQDGPAFGGRDAAKRSYASLWDSLNYDRLRWANNPWVVAYTFTVHRHNIDAMEVAT